MTPSSLLQTLLPSFKLFLRDIRTQARCYKTQNGTLQIHRKTRRDQIMGSLPEEDTVNSPAVTGSESRKPRFLCLHGFRTSAEIMKKQILGKWPDQVTARLDLVFADAPFPAEGKSDVDGIFDPPYYEWFQFQKGFSECRNFQEGVKYIEELMIKHGPFDGLMGFSQGAILSAALPGLQEKGMALTRVPKLKFVVIIAGAKLRALEVAEKAYASKIKCPSLHFIGARDFLKKYGEALVEDFVDPHIICHPRGHTVPRILEDKSMETMLSYLQRIEKELNGDALILDQ